MSSKKFEEVQRRSHALSAQYSGLMSLHVAAVMTGDTKGEVDYRQKLHDTVDLILDCNIEQLHELDKQD